MRFFRSLTSLLALSVLGGNLCLAAGDLSTEYRIEHEIDGKKVVTLVHIFAESPLDNPNLVQQIKTTDLDHVVFMNEIDTGGRTPQDLDPLEELSGAIETQTHTPVVHLRQKRGFFKRLGDAWKLSFTDPSRTPGPADYHYGMVSTIGESASFAAMVFTSADIPIENAIGLVVAQTLLSYANNVWNNSINHFLSTSILHTGRTLRNTTTFFRNMAYEYITSQIFKVIQDPGTFFTAANQSAIFMNTVMVGTGDILLSNTVYRAYRADKAKLAKVNFYVNLAGGLFGSLDLMQHHLIPVLLKIGVYDFRLSGAMLIGYYASMFIAIKASPTAFYARIESVENGFKRIGGWFTGIMSDCRKIMAGEETNDGVSP